jgi:hypothetical protein
MSGEDLAISQKSILDKLTKKVSFLLSSRHFGSDRIFAKLKFEG